MMTTRPRPSIEETKLLTYRLLICCCVIRTLRTPVEAKSLPEASSSETLTLTFSVENKSISLNLMRNRNVPPNSTFYVVENGKVTVVDLSMNGQEIAAYNNKETGDCVTKVEQTSANSDATVQYFGQFNDDDITYDLLPVDAIQATANTNLFSDIVTNDLTYVNISDVAHVVIKQDATATAADFDEPIVSSGLHSTRSDDDRTVHVANDIIDNYNGRQLRNVVDYMVVIDYSIFARWYSSSSAPTGDSKKQDALMNIRAYYAHVVNSIDLRYSIIQKPSFTINVRLIGYYVATTVNDSLTEQGDVTISLYDGKYTNMYKSLSQLATYVNNNSVMFGQADHVALFTDNYLFDGTVLSSGNRPRTFLGLAYIGNVCDPMYRVSIIYELGQYSTIESAAHELGHSLNASHDGTGNQCKGADSYIMAPSPGQLTIANFNNTFQFSSCSIQSFFSFLDDLTRAGKNCMLNTSTLPTIVDEMSHPGQQYTVDQQCQQVYGPQSFYCAGMSADNMICSQMVCWDPDSSTCSTSTELRAMDGTTCGDRRWCSMGLCTADSNAPSANSDICLYGDYRARVYIDSATSAMMCSQIAIQRPSACYDPTIAAQCCKACPSIHLTNSTDCQFGDLNPSYCASQPAPSNCYYSSYRASCCATCLSNFDANLNNTTGCGYGDRAPWCSEAWQCYDSGDTCCRTCSRFSTGIKGCEYGDRATWCLTSSYSLADGCKIPDFASQCCSSCAQYTSTVAPSTAKLPPAIGVIIVAAAVIKQQNRPNKYNFCTGLTGDQCYDAATVCCQTCTKFYVGLPGCEYGDKVPWCEQYVKSAAECQQTQLASVCCQTCSKFQSSNCTDQADWCPGIYAGDCYNSQTSQTCCATCARNLTADPCCRYGDKFSWCQSQFCSTNADDCCSSCLPST